MHLLHTVQYYEYICIRHGHTCLSVCLLDNPSANEYLKFMSDHARSKANLSLKRGKPTLTAIQIELLMNISYS